MPTHTPGIDDLLQTVLWVAEEKALMANPSKLAAGTVIEAHLDKKRGPVATLLVQVGVGVGWFGWWRASHLCTCVC